MAIRRSLLFTEILIFVSTAISAACNLTGDSGSAFAAQPNWMIALHVASAALGSFLLARFIVGSPAALNGPATQSTYAVGMVPRVGAVRFFVPGKNSFFSAKRSAQLVGFVFCLMLQFISIPVGSVDDVKSQPVGQPVRMNATTGSLAT